MISDEMSRVGGILMERFQKLYFLWYFDDDEGYGIEVYGQKPATDTLSASESKSLFCSVVNWSFGHGTWARDLRRIWGDYVANTVAENGGILPTEIGKIALRFNVEKQVLEGDLERITELLAKARS